MTTDMGKTAYVYIYGLVDPRDGRVRYVGQSVNPAARLFAHMTGKGSRSDKGAWLRDLIEADLLPYITVLDRVHVGNDADQGKRREAEWIDRLRVVHKDLLNVKRRILLEPVDSST